jgi:hypothetical protein
MICPPDGSRLPPWTTPTDRYDNCIVMDGSHPRMPQGEPVPVGNQFAPQTGEPPEGANTVPPEHSSSPENAVKTRGYHPHTHLHTQLPAKVTPSPARAATPGGRVERWNGGMVGVVTTGNDSTVPMARWYG